jgi:multiple sugar transport system ATP-binding protein
MTMAHLELRALTKSFGALKVFEDLNLAAQAGEIVVVFGGSGTGKSILLRLIAGVEEPTTGSVAIAGEDMAEVPPEARGIGMAFQNFALFPHFDAAENIAAPLRARGFSADKVKAGVDKVAKLLKIDHVLDHAPRELSNGQKQRTALARALAADPKILLLDDPLRNVDAKLRFEMRLELPRLLRQSGSTVLYVTQDYKEAMALADRIAVLSGGSFVQIATPEEIYTAPATLGVARLFGDPAINVIDITPRANGKSLVADIMGETVSLEQELAGIAGRDLILGIRPEAISVGPARGAALVADVLAVTPFNERTVLLLRSRGGWEFLASLPSSSDSIPKAEQTTGVTFDAAGMHLFDRATGARLKTEAA